MARGKSLKVDKFTRRDNFSLWQIKIRAVLKQQGLWTPLLKPASNPLPVDIATMEENAHSTLLLALEDHIITEVAEEDTDVGMWCKVESLYTTKSLTNKLLLKQHMFSLCMHEGMSLKEHLDQLNSILLDLHNIDIEIDDEDAALILLVSLPLSYENFRESFISGKYSLYVEEVRYALHSRELRHSCSGAEFN